MKVRYSEFQKELNLLREKVHSINDCFSVNASTPGGINLRLGISSFDTEDILESVLFAEQIKMVYNIIKDFKYIGYTIDTDYYKI